MRKQAVRKAVEDHYHQTGECARIRDIAEATGISKSSCHRWAIKLAKDGELERTPSTHKSIRPSGK